MTVHNSSLVTALERANERARPDLIQGWLLFVALLVVLMVAVGGITRLTESGLSITQWNLVSGAIPPLNDADWQAQFALYRQTGEYINVTGPAGMALADFKFIYFWEWAHRLLGRIIGLAYGIPLVWFWARKQIPAGFGPRLTFLLGLGALQGLFGWFMVRSGLGGTMTDVSHFWLSIHLLTALLTLGLLVWTALDMRQLARFTSAGIARITPMFAIVTGIVFVQLLLGAWVAGLNAGHASDSWPLMQDRLVPEYDTTRGLLWALTHDPFLLHFLHRWWAWAAFAAIVVLAIKVKRSGARLASIALHALIGTQVVLGIATVTSGVALWIAVAHQSVGALLVAALAWGGHALGRQRD